MAVSSIEIQGNTAKYNLYFLGSTLKGCSCKGYQFSRRDETGNKAECRHMLKYRQEQADAAALATSCVLCGYPSKSGGLCWRCLA